MAQNQNYARLEALGLSVNITSGQGGWAYLSVLSDVGACGACVARVQFRDNKTNSSYLRARAPTATRGSHLDQALGAAYEAIPPAALASAQARAHAKRERLELLSDPLPTRPSRPRPTL